MLSLVDSIGMELLSSVDSNYIVIACFSIYSSGMALLFSVASNCIINAFLIR